MFKKPNPRLLSTVLDATVFEKSTKRSAKTIRSTVIERPKMSSTDANTDANTSIASGSSKLSHSPDFSDSESDNSGSVCFDRNWGSARNGGWQVRAGGKKAAPVRQLANRPSGKKGGKKRHAERREFERRAEESQSRKSGGSSGKVGSKGGSSRKKMCGASRAASRRAEKEREEDRLQEEEEKEGDISSEADVSDDGDGTRIRQKREWNNDCMPKNSQGKVEISRDAFDTRYQITAHSVMTQLGKTRFFAMDTEDFTDMVEWYQQLKVHAANFCPDRYIEDLGTNSRKLGLPFQKIKDLKSAWKACKTQEEAFEMGKVFHEIKEKGLFLRDNGVEWKVRVEKDFMEQYGLVYIENKSSLREKLGCIGRQATRSRNDVSRRLQCRGQTVHAFIVSKRSPDIVDRPEGYKRRKVVVGGEFRDSFVRPSQPRKNGGGGRPAGAFVTPRSGFSSLPVNVEASCGKTKKVDLAKVCGHCLCFIKLILLLTCLLFLIDSDDHTGIG